MTHNAHSTSSGQPVTGRPVPGWNWIEAFLLGALAVLGVDVALGIVLGLLVGFSESFNSLNSVGQFLSGDSVAANFLLYGVSRALGFGLIIWFIRGRHVNPRQFGFRRFKPWLAIGLIILAGIAFVALVSLGFYLAEQLLPKFDVGQPQEIVFTQAKGWGEMALAFAALVVVAPIVEESIFRGFMLPAFAKKFGVVSATLITSLLFGLVHWQLNVGIVTFVMGLLLAWLYFKTRSLWPAIMFHSLKNLVAFTYLF